MRLTPAPLHLLVAMSRGGVLREFVRDRWFTLERPGRGCVRIHNRSINTLRRLAFIEPTDDVAWRVSGAGLAWLADNGIAADLERLSN